MATKNTAVTGANGNGASGAEGRGDGTADVAGAARPAGAAGAVWDALTGNPGATVARIAGTAGVSRATVARTLTVLEGDGRAVRTPGGRDGGKRLPDTWHATGTATATGTTTASDTAIATTGTDEAPTGLAPAAPADEPEDAPSGPVTSVDGTGAGEPHAPGTDTTGPDTTGTGAGSSDGVGGAGTGLDPAAVAEARDALTALRDGITAALTALDAGDGDGALTAAEGAYSGSGLVRRLVRAAARGPVRTVSGRVRSQPGAMRAKVAAHLTAHPGSEFTPHEVAKVIGHSAGAVSNALDRLTEAGEAELVCERPRRFTATTARRAAAS